MDQLWNVANFILQNWETLAAVAVAVIGFISRRVSKSRAKALESVAEVIEQLDVKEVKEAVAEKAKALHPSAAAALLDAVNTVDPKKPTPSAGAAMVREALRLVQVKR